MPLIAVQVQTLDTPKRMQDNLRIVLHRAGIPSYSYKDKRAGYEVWHAEQAEGQTSIIWHTFTEDETEATAEMRAGLEQCAQILLENYWVQLYVPNRLKMRYQRMHLRVLYGLNWLS